ncbi:membrane protein [Klebsiella michiganensis]|nr:membrane protein [Klebsiella michiganensis]
MTILKQPASRKNHTNVLMHIQGYFRNQLNSPPARRAAGGDP